jgi:hypothetical protein
MCAAGCGWRVRLVALRVAQYHEALVAAPAYVGMGGAERQQRLDLVLDVTVDDEVQVVAVLTGLGRVGGLQPHAEPSAVARA